MDCVSDQTLQEKESDKTEASRQPTQSHVESNIDNNPLSHSSSVIETISVETKVNKVNEKSENTNVQLVNCGDVIQTVSMEETIREMNDKNDSQLVNHNIPDTADDNVHSSGEFSCESEVLENEKITDIQTGDELDGSVTSATACDMIDTEQLKDFIPQLENRNIEYTTGMEKKLDSQIGIVNKTTEENETCLNRDASPQEGFSKTTDTEHNLKIDISNVTAGKKDVSKVVDTTQSFDDSPDVQEKNLSDEESDIIATNPSPESSNDSVKVDERQISDETVSSSNNQIDDTEASSKSKQNENIFEKIQMTSQFDSSIPSESKRDNQTNKQDFSEKVNISSKSIVDSPNLYHTESEKETTDDDIMNFSIEIQEDSDEESDIASNIESNSSEISTSREDKAIHTDNLRKESGCIEIHEESSSNSVVDSLTEPSSSSYIQKISSVIRAIDSSKSTTATKKDRDNIFSFLKAEMSTTENATTDKNNPIVITDANGKTGSDHQSFVSDEHDRCRDVDQQEESKTDSESFAIEKEDKTTAVTSSSPQKTDNIPNVNCETIEPNKNNGTTQKIMEENGGTRANQQTYVSNINQHEDQSTDHAQAIQQSQDQLVHDPEKSPDPVIVSPTLRVEGERSFMQALIPPFHSQPCVQTDLNLSGVKIKVERDNAEFVTHHMEESGDILDILPTNNKSASTPLTSPQPTESYHTVSVTGTFQPTPVRIKQEPVDDYNVITTTVASSNFTASNSLEHLSRQVNNLPKTNNIARKSTTGRPSSAKRFKPQQGIEMPIPNTKIRYPSVQQTPNVISRSNATTNVNINQPVFIQNQRSVNPSVAMTIQPPRPVLVYPSQNSVKVVPTKSTTPSANSKPGSVVGSMQTLTIVSNGKTVNVPTSTIFSVTKVVSSTTTVPKTTVPTPLPKSTINIDTVGLNAITELIARKNPIPNYKPPPIPESFRSLIAEDKCKHICYECGDTFLFESSLRVHRSRTSMSLSYRCEECKQTKIFFNKCQFLGHLRNHLNIDKSQAVPIHIKSDSISITTLDYQSNMNHLFKWLDDISTTPESLPRKQVVDKEGVCLTVNQEEKSKQEKVYIHCSPKITSSSSKSSVKNQKGNGLQICHECGGKYKDLQEHFGYALEDLSHYCCGTCKKILPTICAARAHKRIHEDKEPYVCPECGKSYSTLYVDNKMSSQKESFAFHVYYTCFHTCRMRKIICPKCEKTDRVICTSYQDYQWHLSAKLEQYYKCQICPMAFKLPHSFLKHFVTHDKIDNKRRGFKVIYRCHLCDSVMDDKSVLDVHIMKHVNEARTQSVVEFRCRLCKEWFKTREDLRNHVDKNHSKIIQTPTSTSVEMFTCSECGKFFSNLFDILKHEILFHSNKSAQSRMSNSKCRCCGIIIYGSLWKDHFCLNPNPFKLLQQSKQLTNDSSKLTQKVETSEKMETDDAEENKFTCKLCYKEENSFKSLQGHLLYHQTKGDLICYLCQCNNFSTLAEVHAHQRVCLEQSQIPKDEKVKKEKMKKKATKQVLPSIEYPCEVCGFICLNKTDLAKHHKENHSETGINPCHLCSSTYESQELLKKHIMVTHEGKRLLLPCEICQKRGIKKSFSTRERLEKHLSLRHKVARNKTKHVSSMNEIAPPDVDTDPLMDNFKRKFEEINEAAPVKKLRVDGDAQFTCAKCLYSSNDRSSFVTHLAGHKIENCVQCLECGLSFAVMPSLKKHLFMVHKIKHFENYCKENNLSELPEAKMDDSEIRKGLLIESEPEETDVIETSTSSNPLECRVCYKVFDNEAAVKAHLRTHGMAFIKNRRSKAPSQGRESVNNGEASDGGSK